MKKWFIILFSVVFIGGVGVAVSANDEKVESGSTSKSIISKDDAKNIALEYVEKGQVEDIELEKKNGKLVYEIEIEWMDEDGEIYIDANNGEIIYVEDDLNKWKSPAEDSSNITLNSNKSSSFITKERAIEIALKEIEDGKVKEVEFDEDDGHYAYEIELKSNGKEVEIKISAVNGEILHIDWD